MDFLAIQAHGMITMSNGRMLTFGDYHDVSRPLRRFLKQLGNGNLEEGLRAARDNEDHCRELAKICDLDEQVRTTPWSVPSCVFIHGGVMPGQGKEDGLAQYNLAQALPEQHE